MNILHKFCESDRKLRSFFFFLILLILTYIVLTTVSQHLMLRDVIAWNKELGLGMSFEFGWLGVRMTPIHIAGPDLSSLNTDLSSLNTDLSSLNTDPCSLNPDSSSTNKVDVDKVDVDKVR